MMATVKFTKESKWSEISVNFCRYHGLPYGSAIKVIYTKNPKYPKGRVQRDNTVYKRAVFRGAKMHKAGPGNTVRQLIDEYLLPYIDIDLPGMGAEVAAFFPDGSRIGSPGKTLVRTWREKEPQLTDAEIEAEDVRLLEVEEIAGLARASINDISEFRWNPEDTVVQGVIRALVRDFGIDAVRHALEEETGQK